jgi:hypothetical protein
MILPFMLQRSNGGILLITRGIALMVKYGLRSNGLSWT